jgi:hypothetical protein
MLPPNRAIVVKTQWRRHTPVTIRDAGTDPRDRERKTEKRRSRDLAWNPEAAVGKAAEEQARAEIVNPATAGRVEFLPE